MVWLLEHFPDCSLFPTTSFSSSGEISTDTGILMLTGKLSVVSGCTSSGGSEFQTLKPAPQCTDGRSGHTYDSCPSFKRASSRKS